MAEAAHPQRIDNVTAGLMITVAVIFDILSLIPLLNILVDIIAWLIFGLWFTLRGISFLNPRRFATFAVSFIVGLIPILSILPELTLAIIATILMVKSEDRLGIKLPGSPVRPK